MPSVEAPHSSSAGWTMPHSSEPGPRAEPAPSDAPLVLVLCGPIGAGKSRLSNLLLQSDAFEARHSVASVTTECQWASFVAPDGRRVCVLDTPGLCDPETSAAENLAEMIRGVKAAVEEMGQSQEPVAVSVLLVSSMMNRIDEPVLEALRGLGQVFGRSLFHHCTAVWTHADCVLRGDGSAPADSASAALAAYLADAGDSVGGWLSQLGGDSIALCNPPATARPSDASSTVASAMRTVTEAQLARVLASAAAVAARSTSLEPPKPHRKQARRERQQLAFKAEADAQRRRDQTAQYAAAAGGGGEAAGGLGGLLLGALNWLTGSAPASPPQGPAGDKQEDDLEAAPLRRGRSD